ncbi:hypothetical protein [Bifidobacterium criceti]|nr:hypothetical protein [Bifidobacterium criceti]
MAVSTCGLGRKQGGFRPDLQPTPVGWDAAPLARRTRYTFDHELCHTEIR